MLPPHGLKEIHIVSLWFELRYHYGVITDQVRNDSVFVTGGKLLSESITFKAGCRYPALYVVLLESRLRFCIRRYGERRYRGVRRPASAGLALLLW